MCVQLATPCYLYASFTTGYTHIYLKTLELGKEVLHVLELEMN